MKNTKLEVLAPETENPLTPMSETTGMSIATSRQAQEVQAQMVVAKRFPRNETLSISRVMAACNRLSLAESALYAYPRGGTTVSGPSIRLAESLARSWGNIDFGVIELEQKLGESVVMAYAIDLETNTRVQRVFTVKHERKARGNIETLTDPRDIYEMTANQGARRLRACILSIIPGDVTEMAVDACETTMKSGDKTPLNQRIAKVISFFAGVNVTLAMIEKRLGHKIDTASETELVTLRKIAKSIDDQAAKPEDFFDLKATGVSKPEHATDLVGKSPEQHEARSREVASVPGGTVAGAPTSNQPEPAAITPAPAAAPATDPTDPEQAKLIALLTPKMQANQVTEAQLINWCKKNKLCSRQATALTDMIPAKLALVVENFDRALDKIKAS
jgi:hypothetical protein